MHTATGISLGGTEGSKIRKRDCGRAACGVPAPPRSDKCCDDSCLIEIALRECNKEGSHDLPRREAESESLPATERTLDNDGRTISKSQPCAGHYQAVKDSYGVFLDNLGCICKVLLSLNIESCCTLPHHSSAGVACSRLSSRKHKDVPASLCEPTVNLDLQATEDCSKMACCETMDSPEIVAKTAPGTVALHDTLDSLEHNCCTGTVHTSSTRITKLLNGTIKSHSQDHPDIYDPDRSVPVNDLNRLKAENEPPAMGCTKRGCCDDNSVESSQVSNPAEPDTDTCSSKGCCGQSPALQIDDVDLKADPRISLAIEGEFANPADKDRSSRQCTVIPNTPPKIRERSSNCCGGGTCQANRAQKIGRSISKHMKSSCNARGGLSIAQQSDIDLEPALHGVEHILVRVEGMDCTGCEKKLYRSLATLPELSNIKTSLLLAQAEFDILPSKAINATNIFSKIDKMTGFHCSRMTASGAVLELIVDGNSDNLLETFPVGVKEVTILTKNTVQVFYEPRIVGARDLLQDPYFHNARLAPPSAPPLIASGRAHLRNTFYLTLLSILLTLPVLVLAWSPHPSHEVLYGAISLALATIVQTVVAGPFYMKSINSLVFSRMIDMDLLIVLSSSTAYIYSVIAYSYLAAKRPLGTGQFFETSTLLVTLIMVGRTVSAYARNKAIESITIESLQTPTALLVSENPYQEKEIDAQLLQYGDTFKVLPDTSIVTDGDVILGESEVDESMITGEATLIEKTPGMSVVAGSVNHSGSLIVKVTRLPHENTIKTIGAMVDEAKSSKPRVEEIADRVASKFVPVILALTLVVFVVWIAIGKNVRHQSAAVSAITAMTFAISVLIVSCPCAIGLAVPMVVVIAGGVAARRGLVFKTAETIDMGRKVSHVVFDKTGTLTQGELNVVTEEYLNGDRDALMPLILGLTINSKHPVSKALASHLAAQNVQSSNIENINSVTGNGIEATFNNSTLRAGNPYWLHCQTLPTVDKILATGLTIFCVTLDSQLVAVFGLQDQLRPDALETIAELKKRSIGISVISGDNEAAVHSIAAQLDIPFSNTRSRCSPEEKQTFVASLLTGGAHDCNDSHEHGHKHKHKHTKKKQTTILFIGDGTNDAPSLATASIGLHIGGTAVAASAADAVLMRPSLRSILTLIDLSIAFHRRVVFNFVWSFVYNVAAVLLAAGVLSGTRDGMGVRIPPQYAGLGEVVSVVPVVGIAVGLRWWRG